MLRIVTLNTWKCEGDYAARMRLMARGLEDLGADVLCLQECFSAPLATGHAVRRAGVVPADTALELSRHLGLRSFHAPARPKPRRYLGQRVPSTSGLALLVRTDADATETLALPTDPRDGERIAQALVLHTAHGPLRIVNLHLTHLRDQGELRTRQLEAVLARWGRDAIPTVIAGDFNATFDDAALAPLRSRPDLDSGSVAPDAWPATLLAPDADRAVDHVLLLTGPGPRRSRIVSRRLVLDEPGPTGLLPSDHAGVLVEIVPA